MRQARRTRRVPSGRSLVHAVGGEPDGRDDVLVAGAPAEVAGQRASDACGRRVGLLTKAGLHRHQDPRRAEPALQRVTFVERLLKGMQRRGAGSHSLDGRDPVAIRLDREHQARPDRLPVQLDRARPAHSVLAAEVRAREPGVVADEVRQQQASLNLAQHDATVDLHRNAAAHPTLLLARWAALASARSVIVLNRLTRYSVPPCRSEVGCSPRTASAAAAWIAGSSSWAPLSRSSAARGRTGAGPAATSAMVAASHRPSRPSFTVTAAPPSAKSPCRRANSTNAEPVAWSWAGTSTEVTSSSGAREVVNSATKNFCQPRTREPRLERTWNRASRAAKAAGSSAAGSACATDPPTVPRLRICACPTQPIASCRSGHDSAITFERSTSACRVMAPTTSVPPSRLMPDSSATPLMSIRRPGRASRKFMSGTRLWPPASTLHSSP